MLFSKDGVRAQLDVHVFSNLPIPGIEVHEYVSDIGVRLKKKKVADLTHIALLGQAIVKIRARAGKLTYTQLVKDTGMSLRLVRRLFRAALLSLDTARRVPARLPSAPARVPVPAQRKVFIPSEPFLERGVGLPPPAGIRS